MKYLKSFLIFLFAICLNQVFAQPFDFVADTTIGCDSLSVQFTPTGSGDISWVWDFGNGDTSTLASPPPINYDTAGIYTVQLIVNNSDTIIKEIIVRRSPQAYFIYNDSVKLASYTLLFVDQSQLVDTSNYSFFWDFGDGFFADSSIVSHHYSDSGNYFVQFIVSDDFGCSDSIVRLVKVVDKFNVPNVFTPNEDGKNDFFIVESNGETAMSITIYSRFGTVVYKYTGTTIIWDGRTPSGVPVHPGTYYYVIKSIDATYSKEKSGFIYLIR